MIDSTSVIEVLPCYHFTLPSYHDFCTSISKMDLKNEEKCDEILLEKSAVETVKLMYEAYTEKERLGDSTTFHWHLTFSEGRETAALPSYDG